MVPVMIFLVISASARTERSPGHYRIFKTGLQYRQSFGIKSGKRGLIACEKENGME